MISKMIPNFEVIIITTEEVQEKNWLYDVMVIRVYVPKRDIYNTKSQVCY
jgi:hypothetical protein